MIAPKPTMYRDQQFRSRLEARWAAFFDLSGWRWEYEPVELEGWSPDFRLHAANNSILVEVKPITWGEAPEQVLQADDVAKVIRHRNEKFAPEEWRTELLVLGDGPQVVGQDWVLGVFADDTWCASPDWAVLAAANDTGVDEIKPLDFYCRNGSYAYRMSGAWDGDKHIRHVEGEEPRQKWRRAGNLTQWRGPSSMPTIDEVAQALLKKIKPKDMP